MTVGHEPVDVYEEARQAILGSQILALADRRYSWQWIRRRVEHIRVVNERSMENEITFFIDVSNIDKEYLPITDDGMLILPLNRVSKRHHLVAKIEEEGSGELMRPTQRIERQLVVAGLARKWDKAKAATNWNDVLVLLAEQPEEDVFLVRHLNSDRTPLERLYRLLYPIALKHDESSWAEMISDFRRWQENYLLLVEIPRSHLLDGRIVLKVTYADHIPRAHIVGRSGVNLAHFRALVRKAIAGSMSIGFIIPARAGTGTAESTHYLLDAPSGFKVIDARVHIDYEVETETVGKIMKRISNWAMKKEEKVRNVDDVRDTLPSWIARIAATRGNLYRAIISWSAGSNLRSMVRRDDDRLPESGHVYVPSSPLRVKDARFVVNLYAYRSGFFAESLLASWMLFAITVTFYFHFRALDFSLSSTNIDSSVAGALILLLPAAVVTMVTQRDSHRVASRCFALPRLLLVTSAAASVSGALLIALQIQGHRSMEAWSALYWITLIIAIRLTLGGLVHLVRVSRTREWLLRNVRARIDRSALRNLKLSGYRPIGRARP